MITGTIKNKIDKIWKDIWASGLTQPITVIEQITYLMFIRSLDQKDIDDMSILLKPPFDRPMPFVRLYSPEDQKRIISIVNDINENATRLVG